MAAAATAKANLQQEDAADKALAAAMAAAANAPGDDAAKAGLKACYDAAAALGMATDRMTQARVTLDRDQLVAETEAKVYC